MRRRCCPSACMDESSAGRDAWQRSNVFWITLQTTTTFGSAVASTSPVTGSKRIPTWREHRNMFSLQQLNSAPRDAFVAALAGIFERSPWVAERVAASRPFASRLQLHAAMCKAVEKASAEEQLALIRA